MELARDANRMAVSLFLKMIMVKYKVLGDFGMEFFDFRKYGETTKKLGLTVK